MANPSQSVSCRTSCSVWRCTPELTGNISSILLYKFSWFQTDVIHYCKVKLMKWDHKFDYIEEVGGERVTEMQAQIPLLKLGRKNSGILHLTRKNRFHNIFFLCLSLSFSLFVPLPILFMYLYFFRRISTFFHFFPITSFYFFPHIPYFFHLILFILSLCLYIYLYGLHSLVCSDRELYWDKCSFMLLEFRRQMLIWLFCYFKTNAKSELNTYSRNKMIVMDDTLNNKFSNRDSASFLM